MTALVVLTASPGLSGAQGYPERPIRIVVGYSPGGGTDLAARFAADKMSSAFGQQIVVDNRPGAGSMLATEIVAKSAPDGYTLLQANATIAMPTLFPDLSFDILKDLKPVSVLGNSNLVLTVHPSMPVRSVKDLIALAKKRPGEMNYASAGNGSFIHLAMEYLISLTGMKIVHVPYKGGAPAAIATMSGQTQINFGGLGSSLPYVQQGKLRPLAVSGTKRHFSLPDVPSMEEAGVKGFAAPSWYGLFAPSKTPDPIIVRLSTEARKALADPDVRQRFKRAGIDPAEGGLDEIKKLYAAEVAKWTKVIREAGIKR
ncbi:MAG: Bug family tripartite tricarboxylate transporter substrate binding protein [Burkholderiales bacterium]